MENKDLSPGYKWGKYRNKLINNPSCMFEVKYNLPTTRYTMVEYWGSNSLDQAYREVRDVLPVEAEIIKIERCGSYDSVMKQLTNDNS